MIIKGGSRGGSLRYVRGLAVHLQRLNSNEIMRVRETRGIVAQDVEGALLELSAIGMGSTTTLPLYQASMNWGPDDAPPSEAQKDRAVEVTEQHLGLKGQPRLVVEHRKNGRCHLHANWSRVDLSTMRPIHDGLSYRRHEEAARSLENEFGHQVTRGAFTGRDVAGAAGREAVRPDRRPADWEVRQGERTGLLPADARALIGDLWQRTDGKAAFVHAVADAGWTVARGDKRVLVILDPAGGVHSLARLAKVKTAAVRSRMGDDLDAFPTVTEARRGEKWRPASLAEPIVSEVSIVTPLTTQVLPMEPAPEVEPIALPPTFSSTLTPPYLAPAAILDAQLRFAIGDRIVGGHLKLTFDVNRLLTPGGIAVAQVLQALGRERIGPVHLDGTLRSYAVLVEDLVAVARRFRSQSETNRWAEAIVLSVSSSMDERAAAEGEQQAVRRREEAKREQESEQQRQAAAKASAQIALIGAGKTDFTAVRPAGQARPRALSNDAEDLAKKEPLVTASHAPSAPQPAARILPPKQAAPLHAGQRAGEPDPMRVAEPFEAIQVSGHPEFGQLLFSSKEGWEAVKSAFRALDVKHTPPAQISRSSTHVVRRIMFRVADVLAALARSSEVDRAAHQRVLGGLNQMTSQELEAERKRMDDPDYRRAKAAGIAARQKGAGGAMSGP